jgi:hypothetical protein
MTDHYVSYILEASGMDADGNASAPGDVFEGRLSDERIVHTRVLVTRSADLGAVDLDRLYFAGYDRDWRMVDRVRLQRNEGLSQENRLAIAMAEERKGVGVPAAGADYDPFNE